MTGGIRSIWFCFLAVLSAASLWASCSSGPKHEVVVRQAFPSSIKVRRPLGVPADPKVGPGGVDYQSSPLPDARFDCKAPDVLLEGVRMSAVLNCLRELKAQKIARYRLEPGPFPKLVLEGLDEKPEDSDAPPACLREYLPEILVAREIFFQKPPAGETEASMPREPFCYGARLPVSPKELLGWALPSGGSALVIQFPLESLPSTEEETRRLLLSWSLTPFFAFGEQSPGASAKPASRALCEACFSVPRGSRSTPLEDPLPQAVWPP